MMENQTEGEKMRKKDTASYAIAAQIQTGAAQSEGIFLDNNTTRDILSDWLRDINLIHADLGRQVFKRRYP